MLDEWRRATIMPTDVAQITRPKIAAQESSGEESMRARAKIRKFDEDYETDDTSGSIKVYKPDVSFAIGLTMDMLILNHSFGYDCHKRANLHVIDIDTVLYVAGNFVIMLNLRTQSQKYLHSNSGGGIGAIAVHPDHTMFAVAEKGTAPDINIFSYPEMECIHVLRGGTERSYTFVDFNAKGDLMVSVGGDPDYMLTVWDWKNEVTMLRYKAFSQDVWRVTFSTELAGQLTSSGIGHIRFWKMARTFTGLKLQGALGKFGKTEISDIEGYVELPDGKVVSGSEWGNLLLWEGELIKVEIGRKGKKPCHNGPIQQVIMDEGELMSVGLDGYIRVWNFETIDAAESVDEVSIFEMEPMNELLVGADVQMRNLQKSVDREEANIWYGQDGNGGIWRLDLSFSFTSQAPEKMCNFHAGPIIGVSPSPSSALVATIGVDSSVIVYDCAAKKQLCKSKFTMGGSSILWVPSSVDPKSMTMLAGFADGVVRVLVFQKKDLEKDQYTRKAKYADSTELVLKQVFKPHTRRVTSMAIDHEGKILATGGDDKNVFFLTTGETYDPIGFISVPSEVTHLAWSPPEHDNNTLIVSCRGGEVLEIEVPKPGCYDTSHTYQVSGLAIRTHIFKSVKSTLRHEEELALKAKEDGERRAKEEEERKMRVERGLEIDEEPEISESDSVAEEPWDPYIPDVPSPILFCHHSKDQGKFWVSVGDFDAGYLYECEFVTDDDKISMQKGKLYEPCQCIPVPASGDVPITTITFSTSEIMMILGMQDGSVRLQPLETPGDIGCMTDYWLNTMHDNTYGSITGLGISYNDLYLFTVGADGNFFSYLLMDEEELVKVMEEQRMLRRAEIPQPLDDLKGKSIADIEDEEAYSIEDAKQKSEYDKMIALAEKKKATVRLTINEMRYDFKKLLQKNLEIPDHLRLQNKEFEMAAEIRNELNLQILEKASLVKKQMAWEQEKCRLGLHKLRARYKNPVECERIILKCFRTSHMVCTYRTSLLGDDFYTAKAEVNARRTTNISRDEAARQAMKPSSMSKNISRVTASASEKKFGTVTTTLKGSMGERINKALAKVEEKKRKRAIRRAEWEQLYSNKPPDNYEDPEDVAAIAFAKDNMGDYKLKSASDYVVPDHLRMNTNKARSRLLDLKEYLHHQKYSFNQQLLELRDKKLNIIREVTHLTGQLIEVQKQLPPDPTQPIPHIPEMTDEEMPEKRLEYDIDVLLKFKRDQTSQKTIVFSGGTPSGGVSFNRPTEPKSVGSMALTLTSLKDQSGHGSGRSETDESEDSTLSSLEHKLQHVDRVNLLYEGDRIQRSISELITNFDAELRCLRHDKFKMDVDMKNADLKEVTLFEELQLLKEFEKFENEMEEKVDNKMSENLMMLDKIEDVQIKLESKRKDIDKLIEKEKTLNVNFVQSLGDNNKFAEYLMKVFKKRIKRSKKKSSDNEDSEDESDDDSDEDSDWSESEEESDSESGGYDLDVCPTGCDAAIYDNTCKMREKRLDIEEALSEEKRLKELLNKELDMLQKKAKVIVSALKTAEDELEAFQLEKQRKLNELDVIVILKLHQILHISNASIAPDLAPCLVFEAHNVIRLAHRIKELEQEKGLQKEQKKEARKKHVQLIKDRHRFESQIKQMQEQCSKMMMQKYGRIVDLEILETVTVNRQLEELKEKLRLLELQCAHETAKWDTFIEDAKDEITRLIQENTDKLDQMNMLIVEKKTYEKDLDARQKNLGSEYTGPRKTELIERKRLIQLVQLQAQEVEALKDEILLLSRKGGHILPPAQPPIPHSPHMRSTLPTV